MSAIKSVFGSKEEVAVSSTKSATGHLLGAAGGIEAIYSILALRDQIAPATLNLDEPDDAADGLDLVRGSARSMNIEHALSNACGFGGVNASLLFGVGEGSGGNGKRFPPREGLAGMSEMRNICLVTGGARGIGRASARRAAECGWDVAIAYREQEAAAQSIVVEIEHAGRRAVAIKADVGNESDVVAMFETAETKLGPITGLVNSPV